MLVLRIRRHSVLHIILWLSFSLSASTSNERVMAYVCDRMSFNPSSLDMMKKYLPTRVKNFITTIKGCTREYARLIAENDTDLNSSLFVIEANEPYKKIVFGHADSLSPYSARASDLDEHLGVRGAIRQIVATAKARVGLVPYGLSVSQDKDYYFVAYTQLLELDGVACAVGAAAEVPAISEDFILRWRVRAMMNIIKREGWSVAQKLINEYANPELYFFVMTIDYPYRWLGAQDARYIGLSAQEGQKIFKTRCTSETCDLSGFAEQEVDVAKGGGGFLASDWISHTGFHEIKVAYVEPVNIDGMKCFIGTSYALWSTPWSLAQKARGLALGYKKMIEEIGLSNTISVIKKDNKQIPHTFILSYQEPHYIMAHELEDLIGLAVHESEAITNNVGLLSTLKKLLDFAEKRSGFYAYPIVSRRGDLFLHILQVCYVTSVVANGQRYCIACHPRPFNQE